MKPSPAPSALETPAHQPPKRKRITTFSKNLTLSYPPLKMTTPLLTTTTLLSLTLTLLLLLLALLLSRLLLPPSTPRTLRTLYIWHLFSSLTHLLLEGSFLYNCFFTYTVLPPRTPDYPHPASVGLGAGRSFTHAPFLGHADRAYGSAYGSNAFARLWQEYAKADRRWGGADLGVVAVEVVTVSVGGPVAFWVAEMIRRGAQQRGKGGQRGEGREAAKLWFWASALAVGELYGGWMTFAPEWLSGSGNLETGEWMFLWVYLVFFNALWVWFPLWVLYESYANIARAFDIAEEKEVGARKKA